MQVWRDMTVREKLLRDEASKPYLGRKHYMAKEAGFGAVKVTGEVKGVPPSVAAKVKEARENA